MRYEIYVDEWFLMSVRYISDAAWYLADRMSVGQTVRVVDLSTNRAWINHTAEQIMSAVHPSLEPA